VNAIDELDTKIIETLVKDARTSFRMMAKELEKSPDTIINHYKRLCEEGVIRGSTIIVDPREIGYEGTAAFHIDVSSSGETKAELSTIINTLIKMPSIIVATKTMGDHDLLALGVVHDFDHLMRLGQDMARIPGIKNIQTALWASRGEVCHKYFII
jgi:Lrp/AsnC family transcriptional regulator, regulator for asnA, asnC and gidA